MKYIIVFTLLIIGSSCSNPEQAAQLKPGAAEQDTLAAPLEKDVKKDFRTLIVAYYSGDQQENSPCNQPLSEGEKMLFYGSIDSASVKEACRVNDLVIFEFNSKENADSAFVSISRKAEAVVDGKSSGKSAAAGAFTEEGGSYVVFDNVMVHHFLSCSDAAADLEKDEKVQSYLKQHDLDTKYLRMECGYKNLTYYL